MIDPTSGITTRREYYAFILAPIPVDYDGEERDVMKNRLSSEDYLSVVKGITESTDSFYVTRMNPEQNVDIRQGIDSISTSDPF